ncbi:MAG TPA: beta-propeller fold lactonase family protein [Byssovorax sp.]|jgi:YVTN family beta-propeller protein
MILRHDTLRLAGALLAALLALGASSCSSSPPEAAVIVTGTPGARTSSIAISSDGATLYVVNADADSISIVDAKGRRLVREILLAGAHPAVDASGAYTPSVLPRALTLSPDGATLFVVGERSGKLYAIDAASGAITGSVAVGSEPIGVVLSADGAKAFVAASQDALVARVDVATMTVEGAASVSAKPWALTWSADGAALLVTHMLGPGVTSIDPTLLVAGAPWTLPDVAPRGDKRLAHGTARGIFDVAVRPGAAPELWVLNTLLGIDTAQPDLDFESTAFPAVAILSPTGVYGQTISTDAQDVAGVDGAFTDVVSGPHAITFTDDGAYALVVDTASEDVLVVDASQRLEVSALRPLPGHMPEGIVLSPNGEAAYVDERNTNDVAVLQVDRTGGSLSLTVDGAPIARLANDPMPTQLRLGQHLFYSANSDEYPITKNHWIACATCHMEARSDAVTWRFAQGPRDTPSNAGGTLGTGLLFRTADRRAVQDYFLTIQTEQGGSISDTTATDKALLDALEAFVDHAIPLPIPPTTDPALVAQGKAIFERSDVGCATCHSGPRFTDSGLDNPTLDLSKANLHDVGTCVTAPYPDVAHDDIDDVERAACAFDTPSLNGVADSAPYLHDGSAATLRDVLDQTRGKMGDISSLSDDDLDALVEYLRSL